MEDQITTQKSELTSLGIKDLFYKYVRFLPLFIVSIALSLLVAYVYLRYATSIYSSIGTIIIQDDKNSGGSNDKLDQLFASDGKKNMQNEIEFLQSRPLMARVVRARNLNFTYLAKGNIKELNIYKSCPFRVEAFRITDSSSHFVLNLKFSNNNNFRVNGSSQVFGFGQVFENNYGAFRLMRDSVVAVSNEYNIHWSPTSQAASAIASNLVVAPKTGTGILNISLESTNPQLAADVINELMYQYQEATKEDKNQTVLNRLDFINKELDTVAAQLGMITNKRIAFIKSQGLVDPEAQTSNYLTTILESDREAKQQRVKLDIVYQIENYLRSDNKNVSLVPSSLTIEDPTLNAMVIAYNQAQTEKKALMENAPPGNIAVRQKQEMVEKLRQNILENLRNIRGAYNSVISSLQTTITNAQSQIRLLPEKQQAMEEIDRELTGKLVIYNSLLEKREESAIVLASTISNIKVLQEAVPNPGPIKPNKRNIQLLSILVGIVLPTLFILALELLNDKVTTRFDIEKLTTTTLLGEVGHSYNKDALIVTSNNRGVVAEQFRILRSNLQYVVNHIKNPVILITSSFSGEGKSFISTNIGAVMALAGKRTIILEFDIRKPKVLSHLNMAKRPGLTNYLLGKINIEDVPVKVEGHENLYVFPCGPVPPNPAELLLDIKLDELFDYLRTHFDVVIMDTAPVGMVSDAMTLSKFADCTMYIVRQGHTYKKQIGLIDEFNREKKLPKVSIILNDVKMQNGYGYYGYGRYGYGYGYKSGYFDDEDSPRSTFIGKWMGWFGMNGAKNKKKKRTKV
jgi:tyrosine-protein kinase Etk/Wzc